MSYPNVQLVEGAGITWQVWTHQPQQWLKLFVRGKIESVSCGLFLGVFHRYISLCCQPRGEISLMGELSQSLYTWFVECVIMDCFFKVFVGLKLTLFILHLHRILKLPVAILASLWYIRVGLCQHWYTANSFYVTSHTVYWCVIWAVLSTRRLTFVVRLGCVIRPYPGCRIDLSCLLRCERAYSWIQAGSQEEGAVFRAWEDMSLDQNQLGFRVRTGQIWRVNVDEQLWQHCWSSSIAPRLPSGQAWNTTDYWIVFCLNILPLHLKDKKINSFTNYDSKTFKNIKCWN